MTVSNDRANSSTTESLNAVYRDLVGIHASVAEALSTDPKIMPWAERELRDVLDAIAQSKRHKAGVAAERAMLDIVARRIDTIYAAIVARTDDDRDIVPWTEREIMGVIRELAAFRLGSGRTAAE